MQPVSGEKNEQARMVAFAFLSWIMIFLLYFHSAYIKMKLPRVLPPGASGDDAQGGFDGNVVLLYLPSNCPCPCDLSIVLLLLCNYYKYSESVALCPGEISSAPLLGIPCSGRLVASN